MAYLNQVEGSRFVHRSCPEKLHRNSPQPEVLYSDSNNGTELVIECKAVVWPHDYAPRHRNDHLIANVLINQLKELADDLPLTIDLQPAPLMSRDNLLSIACEISDTIHVNINSIREGTVFHSRKTDLCWSCHLDPDDRVDFNEPPNGVVVRWSKSDHELSYDIPVKLAGKIKQLFQTTVCKFKGYHRARRILLLDPYGSIRYTGARWWVHALKTVPVPSEISEVWLAKFDWVTDFEQGWIFERLNTLQPDRPAA